MVLVVDVELLPQLPDLRVRQLAPRFAQLLVCLLAKLDICF